MRAGLARVMTGNFYRARGVYRRHFAQNHCENLRSIPLQEPAGTHLAYITYLSWCVRVHARWMSTHVACCMIHARDHEICVISMNMTKVGAGFRDGNPFPMRHAKKMQSARAAHTHAKKMR